MSLIGKDAKDININEKIRVREVRLIDESGRQLGIVPTIDALRMARSKNSDLVEVSPKQSRLFVRSWITASINTSLLKKRPKQRRSSQ